MSKNEQRLTKQVKWGALLSYFSIALNVVCGLLYTPWMVRQIGQSQYGLYTLASSLIALFMVDFGLSSATARYVSKYRAEGAEDKIPGFLGAIYKLYIVIDAVIFAALVAVFFCVDTIYAKLTPQELEQFKVVYCIAACYSVINFPFITFKGILTACEKFIYLKFADVLYRILLVGMTVGALLLGWGLYALVAAHAMAGFASLLYKYLVIKNTTTVKVSFRGKTKGLYKEIFGYSVWVTVATLAQRLVFNITPSILGIVANSAAIAVFGIVTTIEGYAYIISTAINGMFMPKISRIYANEDAQQKIMPLMVNVGRFQIVLNGLIVAGFICVGREFILLWMGENYISAYAGIVLVLVPGIFYNSMQIAHTTVMVQNKVKITAFVNIATGVTNVILSFVLSQRYGVIGACISIFAAYVLRVLMLVIFYRKSLQLNMLLFIKECWLKLLLPVGLTVIVGVAAGSLSVYGWLGLVMKGSIVAAVYMICVLIFFLSASERRWLMRHVRPRRTMNDNGR